jgi:hypothetical protein
VHTYSSCCPLPKARGRQLQDGCRAGSSLVEPTNHLGIQGKDNCGVRTRLVQVNSQVSLRTHLARGVGLPQGALGGMKTWLGQGGQLRKGISI